MTVPVFHGTRSNDNSRVNGAGWLILPLDVVEVGVCERCLEMAGGEAERSRLSTERRELACRVAGLPMDSEEFRKFWRVACLCAGVEETELRDAGRVDSTLRYCVDEERERVRVTGTDGSSGSSSMEIG